MLRLKPLGANLNRVDLPNHSVYFSYETPVIILDTIESIYIVRETIDGKASLRYSKTTNKHIRSILGECSREFVNEAKFMSLLCSISPKG